MRWQRIELTAKDYLFTGMPKAVKAGVVSFGMKNTSASEMHVLLVFRRPVGAKGTALEFVNDTFTAIESGDQAKMGAVSDQFIDGSGIYLFACPIPLQGKDGAGGHYMSGMVGEFTVR